MPNERRQGGPFGDDDYLEVVQKAPEVRMLRSEWRDYSVWAVGSNPIFLPRSATINDLALAVLNTSLGPDWFNEQRGMPIAEQHILYAWLAGLPDAINQATVAERGCNVVQVQGTGHINSVLRISHDLLSLRAFSGWDASIVDKLKNPRLFQGARYEIGAASAMLRAGFKVRWIPTTQQKTAEFEAALALTGESMLVEAKSRHISGVLNHPGSPRNLEELRVVLKRYVNDARKHLAASCPGIIFVDLNMPPKPENLHEDVWAKRISEVDPDLATPGELSPENVVVMTNMSDHYYADRVAYGRFTGCCFQGAARVPFQDRRTAAAVYRASECFGRFEDLTLDCK